MTKASILVVLALAYLVLPSCVAGGSGVKLEAKESAGKVDLRIRYFAFGGANLEKLKKCVVQYGSDSSIESTKVIAVENSREREVVQWVANTPIPDNLKNLPVRLTFFTEELIGRNTISDWTVETDSLTSEYQLVDP